MSTPVPAMLYTQGYGSRPENVEIPFYSVAAPASNNVNFPLGKRWITSSGEYVLTSFTSSNGVLTANWTLLGSAGLKIIDAGLSDALSNTGSTASVNVTSANATTSSIIIYSPSNNTGSDGNTSIVRSDGSFIISSDNAADTRNFFYIVVNP